MSSGRNGAIRVGCSGWNYASWKDEFYGGKAARLWLEHYARHFDTVEVNNTFYRLPNRDAVANWQRTAPPGFVFAVKADDLIDIPKTIDLPGAVEMYPLFRSWKRIIHGNTRQTTGQAFSVRFCG